MSAEERSDESTSGDNVIQAQIQLTGTPGTRTPRSHDLSGPERAVNGSGVAAAVGRRGGRGR